MTDEAWKDLPKCAIVLRGPTGVGKTTLGREIRAELGETGGPVNLDRGWIPGEIRYQGGNGRYADLDSSTNCLVIELTWGDPADFCPTDLRSALPAMGATAHPEEWIEVLQQAGREIVLVRLLPPPWRTAEREIWERGRANGNPNPSSDILWGALLRLCYEHDPYFTGLAERLALDEVQKERGVTAVEILALVSPTNGPG